MANVSNEYIAPQLAAALLYAQARDNFKAPFTRLTMSSSSHSYNKNGKAYTCTQSFQIQFESPEPYQASSYRMDVDLCDKQGHVQMKGKGMDDIYVFPSDADALELWLVQFKFYLRSQFAKDNTNG